MYKTLDLSVLEKWEKLIVDPDAGPDHDQSQNLSDCSFLQGLAVQQLSRPFIYKLLVILFTDRQTNQRK